MGTEWSVPFFALWAAGRCATVGAAGSVVGPGELDDHADHGRVRPGGSGADHFDSELVAEGAGFGVEIVEDFHVIGEEADGDEDGIGRVGSEIVADVGF